MNTGLIIWFLFLHWIADFVLQTDDIAKLKSKNNFALGFHCIAYASVFIVGTLNFNYGLLLGLIHFPADYVTSRLNSRLYKAGKNHKFFVSIGFDQLIHFITIFLLAKWLL